MMELLSTMMKLLSNRCSVRYSLILHYLTSMLRSILSPFSILFPFSIFSILSPLSWPWLSQNRALHHTLYSLSGHPESFQVDPYPFTKISVEVEVTPFSITNFDELLATDFGPLSTLQTLSIHSKRSIPVDRILPAERFDLNRRRTTRTIALRSSIAFRESRETVES